MTIDDYGEKILETSYIQEWFADEPCTIENAIDCIIDAHPLPAGITKEMVADWVVAEVEAYNEQCEEENKVGDYNGAL